MSYGFVKVFDSDSAAASTILFNSNDASFMTSTSIEGVRAFNRSPNSSDQSTISNTDDLYLALSSTNVVHFVTIVNVFTSGTYTSYLQMMAYATDDAVFHAGP